MMKRYNVTFILDTCTVTTTVEFDGARTEQQIIMYAADCINADLALHFDVMDQALDTIVEEL
jgi:hypothetical protein